MSRIYFVGEQVTSIGQEIKGYNSFTVSSQKVEGIELQQALEGAGHQVDRLPTSEVPLQFPEQTEGLKPFDVIILSDVGADSFWFHPEVLSKSLPHPNRLKLIRDFVADGGALIMVGGWMSFGGVEGKAKYHKTEIEEVLPVECLPYDDRVEKPEGIVPEVMADDHPILKDVPTPWPYFLGYNQVKPKNNATVILGFDRGPLLCIGEYGRGRTAAFTTDCAPHWGPQEYLEWEGHDPFWTNLIGWLTKNN